MNGIFRLLLGQSPQRFKPRDIAVGVSAGAVALVLAMVALLMLLAALVVALEDAVGVAGALAIIGAVLVAASAALALTARHLMKPRRVAVAQPSPAAMAMGVLGGGATAPTMPPVSLKGLMLVALVGLAVGASPELRRAAMRLIR